MILIQLLLVLSIALSLAFAWELRPWRSADTTTAWVLVTIALASAALETVFLAATLNLYVPPLLALAVFLANDVAMVWRLVVVRRARRSAQPKV